MSVLRVTTRLITFSPSFKVAAVEAYLNNQRPIDIFRNAGFNIELVGREMPKRSLLRWRKVYARYGIEGLLEERRGQNRKARSNKKEDISPLEKLKRAEARIKLLKAENELLKKLEALERHQHKNLSSSECFRLINLVIRKYELKRVTRYLCQTANVSTSGYYRWCKAEECRQLRACADQRDYLLILEHFQALNGKAGALVIKMRLERMNGIIMNHKKIRRIMKMFHLVATIRQANPYRRIRKATQEHQVCPKLLQRQFDQGEPEKVLLTDITYLRYGTGQWAYLSCVKDGATK